MKNLLLALALVAAPAVASAQVIPPATTSAAITTAIKVKSAVTLTAGDNVDFGTVVPGSTASVDVQGVTTGASAGSVGLVTNQAVTISVALTDLASALASTAPDLSVTSPVCGLHTARTADAQTVIKDCAGFTTASTGGTFWVFVGGSVTTASTTAAGGYAGTATVTASYIAY
ncbi:MAG: hypothetical protein JWL60_1524 [Gemmatimonadetes bacterium]|jgi:hypothetical protein|nr:hypothetical protein [Gemmatimonadota bacterium]